MKRHWAIGCWFLSIKVILSVSVPRNSEWKYIDGTYFAVQRVFLDHQAAKSHCATTFGAKLAGLTNMHVSLGSKWIILGLTTTKQYWLAGTNIDRSGRIGCEALIYDDISSIFVSQYFYCGQTNFFICEKITLNIATPSSGPGQTPITNGSPLWKNIKDSKFIILHIKVDQGTAELYCLNHFAARLADATILHSETDFALAMGLDPTSKYWTFAGAPGKTGLPCPALEYNGVNFMYSRLPCNEQHYFICEKTVTAKITPSMASTKLLASSSSQWQPITVATPNMASTISLTQRTLSSMITTQKSPSTTSYPTGSPSTMLSTKQSTTTFTQGTPSTNASNFETAFTATSRSQTVLSPSRTSSSAIATSKTTSTVISSSRISFTAASTPRTMSVMASTAGLASTVTDARQHTPSTVTLTPKTSLIIQTSTAVFSSCSERNSGRTETIIGNKCYLVTTVAVDRQTAYNKCQAWKGTLADETLNRTVLSILSVPLGEYWINGFSGTECRTIILPMAVRKQIACSFKKRFICVKHGFVPKTFAISPTPSSTTPASTTPPSKTPPSTTPPSSTPASTTTPSTTLSSSRIPPITTTSVTNTTISSREDDFIMPFMMNGREYLIINVSLTNAGAQQFCMSRFHTSLVSFLKVQLYFTLLKELQHSKPAYLGHYWVGDFKDVVYGSGNRTSCLRSKTLNGHWSPTLTLVSCLQEESFICAGPIDEKNVLKDKQFQKMISDMTVERNATKRHLRKKISAYDKRVSARTVGSLGLLVFLSVLFIIAAIDLTGWKKHVRMLQGL